MTSSRKEALLRAMKDPDQNVRSAVTAALDLVEGRENLQEIFTFYKEGGTADKLRAIFSLRKLRDDRALTLLMHASKIDCVEVRAAAVDTIADLGLKRGISAVTERLNDNNREVRLKAIRALGGLGMREAVPSLLLRLDSDDIDLKIAAIESLGGIGSLEAEEKLVELLKESNAGVRAKSAEALGNLSHP